MRRETCEACGETFAANDLFVITGRRMCEPCADAMLAEGKFKPQPGDVQRNVDPTVCGWCAADHDQSELEPLVGVPTCGPCATRMRNWPFPLWIKASFAALLCVAVVAFAYNFRFFKAYVFLRQAEHTEDQERSSDLYIAASELVPESKELKLTADLLRGIKCVEAGEDEEALKLLLPVQASMPNNVDLRPLILRAEIGVAFDAQDFDLLLEKSKEFAALSPQNGAGALGLASANACMYAKTGNEEFKNKVTENLAEAARQGAADHPEFAKFKNRVEHRLATREIVTKKEFDQRYPQGWVPDEAAR